MQINKSFSHPCKVSRIVPAISRSFATEASTSPSPRIHQISPIIPRQRQTGIKDDVREEEIAPSGPVDRLARKLRDTAPVMTETYVAYSATDKLLKECARLADYSIPQSEDRDLVVPKTKEGEDMGVGQGWWYESMASLPFPFVRPRF